MPGDYKKVTQRPPAIKGLMKYLRNKTKNKKKSVY